MRRDEMYLVRAPEHCAGRGERQLRPVRGVHGKQRDLNDEAVTFVGLRPRLHDIAFRVLRDAGDAEDVVQDIWLRWQSTDRSVIDSPLAFLSTATRRMALNMAASARRRRETPVEAGTPDIADRGLSPQSSVERSEQIEVAVRILLERLTATECAVFVLRESFGYPYQQIAEALGLETANARQLVSRARQRVRVARPAPVDRVMHQRLVAAFHLASGAGDFTELVTLLSDGSRHQRAS